ncbi:cutinase family protein [Dietzia sp. 179-F 9C3 NHS]|uniref:cutinase family protein n=1 Tax=Dietzia sp. 179-F 9C3 NHS TaxID=3374295 RepID=UPI003879E79F
MPSRLESIPAAASSARSLNEGSPMRRFPARVVSVSAAASVVALLQAGAVHAQTAVTPTAAPTPTSTPLTSTVEVPTSTAMTSDQLTTSVTLPDSAEGTCPVVTLIAVNGTGEAGRNDSTTADTGWMAQIARPAVQTANADGENRLSRLYVPYPASFGGMTPDQEKETYAESMTVGVENGTKLIEETVKRCPETKIFVSGYSQGAQVASAITRDIGSGTGPVEPDNFAGAALMSDPTRAAGSPVFPGDASRTTPGAVPGTEGTAVSAVDAAGAAPVAPGGGIAPNTAAADFGEVSDRVASFCVPGDLACDTAEDADLLKLVANVAGQSRVEPGQLASDPVRALADVATVTGQSVLFTGLETIKEDINFSAEEGFTIAPATRETTTLARMAKYSDPTQRPEPGSELDAVVEAGMHLAGMALGATITVARDVLTPTNIAEILAAGVANPAAGAAVLAGKLALSATQLITPATINSGMRRVATEIEQTIEGNDDLVKLAADVETWQAIGGAHGAYNQTPFSNSGATPATIAKQWSVAAANDVAASRGLPVTEGGGGLDSRDRIEQIKAGVPESAVPVARGTHTADATALQAALEQVA